MLINFSGRSIFVLWYIRCEVAQHSEICLVTDAMLKRIQQPEYK